MNDLVHEHTVRIAFRIGVHCGAAIEAEDGDVFGDSVNVAARMVALAKSGQVILTASTADELSPELRDRVREVDVMTVKGKDKDIAIMIFRSLIAARHGVESCCRMRSSLACLSCCSWRSAASGWENLNPCCWASAGPHAMNVSSTNVGKRRSESISASWRREIGGNLDGEGG